MSKLSDELREQATIADALVEDWTDANTFFDYVRGLSPILVEAAEALEKVEKDES